MKNLFLILIAPTVFAKDVDLDVSGKHGDQGTVEFEGNDTDERDKVKANSRLAIYLLSGIK